MTLEVEENSHAQYNGHSDGNLQHDDTDDRCMGAWAENVVDDDKFHDFVLGICHDSDARFLLVRACVFRELCS